MIVNKKYFIKMQKIFLTNMYWSHIIHFYIAP